MPKSLGVHRFKTWTGCSLGAARNPEAARHSSSDLVHDCNSPKPGAILSETWAQITTPSQIRSSQTNHEVDWVDARQLDSRSFTPKKRQDLPEFHTTNTNHHADYHSLFKGTGTNSDWQDMPRQVNVVKKTTQGFRLKTCPETDGAVSPKESADCAWKHAKNQKPSGNLTPEHLVTWTKMFEKLNTQGQVQIL